MVNDTNLLTQGFFDEFIEHDFFRLICGERLGNGAGREVWTINILPGYVIKFEETDNSFQNVAEWDLWHSSIEAKNGSSKWLAPCHSISPCGRVLIMKQTKTISTKSYPKQIPAFLTDTKYGNFGKIGNRFVAHDYGVNRGHKSGLSMRMKNVAWWQE